MVDVLLTRIMRGESKVCDVAETVYVDEGSLGRAVEREFGE